MRISEITAFHVAARLREDLGASNRRPPLRTRESLVVRISSDDGLVGYGECSGPPAVLAAAVRHLRPVVLGSDPRHLNALSDALMVRAREEGPSGLLVAAASGIDLALWDMTAKSIGVPLSALFGGPVRKLVPMYAASVYFSPLDQAIKTAQRFVAAGFDAIKVKVGLGVSYDLERVAAIREAIGANVRLLLDANGAYDEKTAIAFAEQLAPYSILWLEEPVPASNLEGSRAVRRAVRLKIAGGEALHTRYGFEPWLAGQALDVAMPDLGRCGGLTEALAIAAMASACRIAVSPHCWGCSIVLAASVQLVAALPHGEVMEFDAHPDPLRDALIGSQLAPRAGAIALPDLPGLGVEVDENALRELTISIGV